MNPLTAIVSQAAIPPVEAIGKVLDKLFTSDEERATAAIVMEKLRQHPAELQVELNKIEAQNRSAYIAGWRPFIGYICGIGLAITFIIDPLFQWVTGKPGPELPTNVMMDLVIALLGLGTLRTVEKIQGKTK